MGQAKEIRVAPISKRDADALIIRLHYSHKTVNNAFLALGVFLNGRFERDDVRPVNGQVEHPRARA